MKFTIICAIFAICIAGVLAETKIDWKNLKVVHLTADSPIVIKKLRIPTPRVFNGNDVTAIQHIPYQCRLILNYEEGQAGCGCSIIADNVLMTAAHCLTDVISVTIYAGTVNSRKKQDSEQKQEVDKSAFIVHEKYDRPALINDIALIKLPKKLVFNDSVKKIDLPCGKYGEQTRFDDEWTTVSGWGAIGNGRYSDIMQYAYVSVENNAACKKVFPAYITDTHICSSGRTATGVCAGDSGGPMAVIGDNNENVVLGVGSFIYSGGCELPYPRVFTRVSSFLDWIKQKSNVSC